MRIVDHWLEGATRKITLNVGGALKPDLLVMHYTASSNAGGAVSWLCDPRAKASAHLVIDEKGNITQLAPFNIIAWHAGVSQWKGRKNINQYAVGIELSNPGLLNKTASGKYVEAIGGKIWSPDNVILAAHKNDKSGTIKPWAKYTEAQINAATNAAIAIVDFYKIKEIVGHDDIAPGRKIDPGPAFPMASFVGKVMGRR